MEPSNKPRKYDFKWAFGLNRLSLRLMGVWPGDDENMDSANLLLRVPVMITVIMLGFFLPQMYAMTLVIHELPLVIDNLLTSCAGFTSCIKLYFIWTNKKVLRPAVKIVTEDWMAVENWQLASMRREAKRAKLFTVSGYVILSASYTSFTFAPLIGLNIRIINNITDYGQRHLMLQSYYPYDYSTPLMYKISQAGQSVGAFFVCMAISIPDNYFAALVFHASAQFEILGQRVERLLVDTPPVNRKDFSCKVGRLIERHCQLMKMTEAIDQSFCFVTVSQIFCMFVMIICLGFHILAMIDGTREQPSILQIVTLINTLITLMMHTLVDCFASETLATRSSGLFHNIYNCEWYTIPHYDIRLFVPMMLLAKNPRQLTAGKLFYLSLSTYCSIVKSTAGYISVLLASMGR